MSRESCQSVVSPIKKERHDNEKGNDEIRFRDSATPPSCFCFLLSSFFCQCFYPFFYPLTPSASLLLFDSAFSAVTCKVSYADYMFITYAYPRMSSQSYLKTEHAFLPTPTWIKTSPKHVRRASQEIPTRTPNRQIPSTRQHQNQ